MTDKRQLSIRGLLFICRRARGVSSRDTNDKDSLGRKSTWTSSRKQRAPVMAPIFGLEQFLQTQVRNFKKFQFRKWQYEIYWKTRIYAAASWSYGDPGYQDHYRSAPAQHVADAWPVVMKGLVYKKMVWRWFVKNSSHRIWLSLPRRFITMAWVHS